ncbi:hypothetical protein Sfulv_41270 [Streptomyces fulvorobeus]|uniref:Uncharacterized protein n=1 Tax=Streptomyces fulvorobeus TaxID=284028 RepID=A0A7J0CC78_9ACTN|nr:hypothetical protein Sfulv_41270 [Streptomyces fulvorobeus]
MGSSSSGPRGHGKPQGCGRAVLQQVDAALGQRDIDEDAEELAVDGAAVCLVREDPAAHRVVVERLVQDSHDLVPVPLVRLPYAYIHALLPLLHATSTIVRNPRVGRGGGPREVSGRGG